MAHARPQFHVQRKKAPPPKRQPKIKGPAKTEPKIPVFKYPPGTYVKNYWDGKNWTCILTLPNKEETVIQVQRLSYDGHGRQLAKLFYETSEGRVWVASKAWEQA